jgi:hypothetical protein
METQLEMVERAIGGFSAASAAIKVTFNAESAPEIVSAVLKGRKPRNGVCDNGWEYYVHGVGFTVVLPSGGQAHFDGSKQGDFFTAHDIAFFLETAEGFDEISLQAIQSSCETMCERGIIRCLGDAKYSLMPKGG